MLCFDLAKPETVNVPEFNHELCRFSASVNSTLVPDYPANRYVFSVLSVSVSVASTCMHTHTCHRSCLGFLPVTDRVFLSNPVIHTTTNHDKHGLLSIKKRQSIHPINKCSQNKSNFTHCFVSVLLAVWV